MIIDAKLQDRLLLGAAFAAALGSVAWFATRSLSATHGLPSALAVENSAAASYAPSGIDAPNVATETWAPPPAQSRGTDWVYEVLTPPEIFYDARTRQFTVNAPKRDIESKPAPPPPAFGLVLLEVKRDLFRLQLIGYMGGAGNYRGTFENALTTETFLAGAGHRIPALGLEIVSFDVVRREVRLPDSMVSNQMVATATVRDERTGETITLTSLGRCLTGDAVAVVAATDEPGTRRELRPGESFKSGGHVYKITKIQLAPPAADVTKESTELSKPELRTLTPASRPTPPLPAAPPSNS